MDGATPILEIEGLSVEVDGHQVLAGVDLLIAEGETHVLLGPNGSGKTTLLNTVLGLPRYQVTGGRIVFKGQDLAGLAIDERARLGLGVAFQRPPAVRGVKLEQLIRVAGGNNVDDSVLEGLSNTLTLGHLLSRDVNMGFSGGEMKRSEMAQLLAQRPDLTLLDEPESGVDLDNIAVVGEAINSLLKPGLVSERKRAGLIVTHTGHILDYVNADTGHVLMNGRLACQGNPRDLIDEISSDGYLKCVECQGC